MSYAVMTDFLCFGYIRCCRIAKIAGLLQNRSLKEAGIAQQSRSGIRHNNMECFF
jgi:hypothetical protein